MFNWIHSVGAWLVLHVSWNRPWTIKLSKPFHVHTDYIRGRKWNDGHRTPARWMLHLNFGPGAGYIGGWTFYVGRGVRGGRPSSEGSIANYVDRPFAIGLTRGGNLVPYLAH